MYAFPAYRSGAHLHDEEILLLGLENQIKSEIRERKKLLELLTKRSPEQRETARSRGEDPRPAYSDESIGRPRKKRER